MLYGTSADYLLRRRRCLPKHSFILGVEKSTYFEMVIGLTQLNNLSAGKQVQKTNMSDKGNQ